MARLQGSFALAPTSITGGTPQTLIQIAAPTNQRLAITQLILSFDGTNSANTPATVKVERQTGGTFTNTAVAPKKINDPSGTGETLQAVAHTAVTAEPTESDVLAEFVFPVFGGFGSIPYPLFQEIVVPGGTLLGIKIAAAQTVNCSLTVIYEE